MKRYVLGLDYGTNNVRAVVVDPETGAELGTGVAEYPSGEHGVLLRNEEPHLARQNPADYVDGFYRSVAQCLAVASQEPGFTPQQIVGLGVDTTGSTPLPVDATGVPLACHPEFKEELAAYAWLWKDHTAHAEAEEITHLAQQRNEPYLAKCGGTYSSEWYWSKILRCLRTNPRVANAAASWVEFSDWIPGFLTGRTKPGDVPRSICTAGHKAMYHSDWGGLPSPDFLDALRPGLSRFRFESVALCANQRAGTLLPEIAQQAGLPRGIQVAYGALDAHLGAVGAGCKPGTLVKIMGTSTCDCMVAPLSKSLPDVPGLCGIAPESILPEMYGLEAGQSAVGDIFNWFVSRVAGGDSNSNATHASLTGAARQLRAGESGLLALDWNNGNRTILVDPLLTGLLVGQTLHTTAAEIYRALIEATAFGALTIIRRLEEYSVAVEEVVVCGGIADKNPLVMQIYADICNRPMKLSRSSQSCALGAAIMASVVAGVHADVATAQRSMTGTKDLVFTPETKSAATYARIYPLYRALHNAFGLGQSDITMLHCMKELLRIRDTVRLD